MSSFSFYVENDHALQKPAVVTRDSLGVLAALIVAQKHDLSDPDYPALVRDLKEEVVELHRAFHSAHLSDC